VVWSFARNQDGAKQFLADLIDSSRTSYEKSAGCNFPLYQKALPNLIARLAEDPADPPFKYTKLKDALYWTRNLGFPGFANPVGMEVFNRFVIPRMFISVVTGRSSPQDAVQAADSEITQIADRWKQA
jgi:multiple sugar transport system substrate-binding protein